MQGWITPYRCPGWHQHISSCLLFGALCMRVPFCFKFSNRGVTGCRDFYRERKQNRDKQEEGNQRLRIILTAQQAIEIYKLKPQLCATSCHTKARGQSIPIAEQYGVSPKTIRDIWNHRTWAVATKPLYSELDSSNEICCLDLEVCRSVQVMNYLDFKKTGGNLRS